MITTPAQETALEDGLKVLREVLSRIKRIRQGNDKEGYAIELWGSEYVDLTTLAALQPTAGNSSNSGELILPPVREDVDPNQFAVILTHLDKGKPAAPWMLEALQGYFQTVSDNYEASLAAQQPAVVDLETPPELPDRSDPEAVAKFTNDCAWWMERNRKHLVVARKMKGDTELNQFDTQDYRE